MKNKNTNTTEQPEGAKLNLFDRESKKGWIIAGSVLILLAGFLIWLLAFPHSREYTRFSKRLTKKIETRFSVTLTDDVTLKKYDISKENDGSWSYTLLITGVDEPEKFMEKNIRTENVTYVAADDTTTVYKYFIEYDSEIHYSDTEAIAAFNRLKDGTYDLAVTIYD